MRVWHSLRHLLPAFAMLGLLLSPVIASAMSAGFDMPLVHSDAAMAGCDGMARETAQHHAMTERMPCNSPEQPASADCGVNCPMVTVCFGKILEMTSGATAIHVLDLAQILVPGNGLFPESLVRAPPLQPPQA